MSASQLYLPAVPATCCRLSLETGRCTNPVAYVLFPGATGHCEAHNPEHYRTMASSWVEAFAAGRARIVRLE